MRAIPGGLRPWPVVSAGIVLAAVAVLVLPIAAGAPVEVVVVASAAVVVFLSARHALLRWPSLLTMLVLVILFVPIRRYVLPGSLPFQLEPYRLLIAILAAIWLTALLIDPRIRVRRTGLEGPLALFLGAVIVSVLANNGRISDQNLDSSVAKTLTFLAAYVIVLYLFVSVLRTYDDVVRLLKVLVLGGAVVAFFAVVESRSGFNVFNHLQSWVPFLKRDYTVDLPLRNGRFRAYGPAEHAIALSAALAMLVPFAAYFGYTLRKRIWWLAAAMIAVGCLSTVSRTGVVMLLIEALVFVILRPRQAVRLWPALIPFLLAVHFAIPGTLGTLKASFFPQGGLVKEQEGFQDQGRFGKGRLNPTFNSINAHPLFGIGYGTRIVATQGANARVLDDQWLDNVLETGIIGAFAWLWILVRCVRRLGSAAKRDFSERGWLLAALASAIAAYGVSMFTYDAFSFVQVTFLFWMLVAFASVLELRHAPMPVTEVVRSRTVTQPSLGPLGFGLILFALAIVLFVFGRGTSIGFLSLVLGVMAVGAWAAERTLSASRA